MLIFLHVVSFDHVGPAVFQVKEDWPWPAAGRLDRHSGPHHVLLQTGHCQVWGLGPTDARGAVCAQGQDRKVTLLWRLEEGDALFLRQTFWRMCVGPRGFPSLFGKNTPGNHTAINLIELSSLTFYYIDLADIPASNPEHFSTSYLLFPKCISPLSETFISLLGELFHCLCPLLASGRHLVHTHTHTVPLLTWWLGLIHINYSPLGISGNRFRS